MAKLKTENVENFEGKIKKQVFCFPYLSKSVLAETEAEAIQLVTNQKHDS